MKRKAIAALAVTALLFVAGCSALPGGNSDASTGDTTPQQSSNLYVQSGSELSAAKLTEDHAQTLQNHSYQSERSSVVKRQDGGMSLNTHRVVKIDRADQQYLSTVDSTFGTKIRYTDGQKDVTYAKTYSAGGEENASLRKEAAPYKQLKPVGTEGKSSQQFISTIVRNMSYTVEGVDTYNGTEVTRLTVTNASGYKPLADQLNKNQTVKEFNSALLVANDKEYVRYMSMHLVVENTATNTTSVIDISMSFSVGDTDVKKPAWTSKTSTVSG